MSKHFKTIVKRLLKAVEGGAEAKGEAHTNHHTMTDLALAMSGSLDAENTSLLLRCVRPQLAHKDATLQKKSYKVMMHLLQRLQEDYAAVARPEAQPAPRSVRRALLNSY